MDGEGGQEREQGTSRQKKRCSASISSLLAAVAINDLYLNQKPKRLRKETISEICRALLVTQGSSTLKESARTGLSPCVFFLSRWNGIEDGRWAGYSAVSFFFLPGLTDGQQRTNNLWILRAGSDLAGWSGNGGDKRFQEAAWYCSLQ